MQKSKRGVVSRPLSISGSLMLVRKKNEHWSCTYTDAACGIVGGGGEERGHWLKHQSKYVKVKWGFLMGVGSCRWAFPHAGDDDTLYA